MDKQILRRRQLLWYFGFGMMAAGITTTLLQRQISSTRTLPLTGTRETPVISTKPSPLVSSSRTLPEFQSIQQWLNSEPLMVSQLKGKVVLVQFWTLSCINCIRTLPYITRWHHQYASQGLQVIGVHTPEFAFEREIPNIQAALKQHQIRYPVPVDNEFKTWKAYRNQFWPHLFLADRDGVLRYDHIGEGAYDETERTIRQLLG
jgi:thiol-disulfide isomerase/thioredoxin